MHTRFPVTIGLRNAIKGFDGPIAKMIVELVGEYERENYRSAVDLLGEELGKELDALCGLTRADDLYLRLYAAVATDIAAFAKDYDFDDSAPQRTTINVLLSELDIKMHNRDEHDEPLDDEFDPTEILNNLVEAGWDPIAANATGLTMLHEFAGDETIDPGAAATAIEWLLAHGANVNATDADGVTPLHLAALTGFGVVHTLLRFGADKTLRTTAPTSIALYAARGAITVPAGSTAYDLTQHADLPDDLVAELALESDISPLVSR